ncbi:MAG: type II secretion system protein GspG, partial [Kiritimatiellae bacterium]|nr:type II secretion system protein GspG [Kiritimatiellia bacterium]
VAIFMLLLGMALAGASQRRDRRTPGRSADRFAWTTRAIDTLAMALEHYKTDCGAYPSREDGGLLALVKDPGADGWAGPYVSSPGNDGWNRPWIYRAPGPEGTPVLYSGGPDKEFGTADDIVAKPEQFRTHPDFIPHDPARLNRAHRSSVSIAP